VGERGAGGDLGGKKVSIFLGKGGRGGPFQKKAEVKKKKRGRFTDEERGEMKKPDSNAKTPPTSHLLRVELGMGIAGGGNVGKS